MVGPLPKIESTLISSAWAGISVRHLPIRCATSCKRPVVLVERENAVVRLAQSLAVDRRQVRLRIEIDQQRRRDSRPSARGEIQRRGGLADPAFLVENRHPHRRLLPFPLCTEPAIFHLV
jgi:hypothetical protein